jgi:hypothetical protein
MSLQIETDEEIAKAAKLVIHTKYQEKKAQGKAAGCSRGEGANAEMTASGSGSGAMRRYEVVSCVVGWVVNVSPEFLSQGPPGRTGGCKRQKGSRGR